MDDINIMNLQKIGLSYTEAKVYLNLLKKKNFTATEISQISGVSRSKIYEILNKLINKGLCIEIRGNVKKYAPTNPETAFNGILLKNKQQFESEHKNKKKLVFELSKTLTPLYISEKQNTDALNYIEVIREKTQIAEKVHILERNAEKEIISFSKAPFAMSLNNVGDNNISFKCGVKHKGVYEAKELRKPKFFDVVKSYEKAGEEIRVVEHLPLKLHIFDEKTVVFALENRLTPRSNLTTMIIEHEDLAHTLKENFQVYWDKALTLDEFIENEK